MQVCFTSCLFLLYLCSQTTQWCAAALCMQGTSRTAFAPLPPPRGGGVNNTFIERQRAFREARAARVRAAGAAALRGATVMQRQLAGVVGGGAAPRGLNLGAAAGGAQRPLDALDAEMLAARK